MALITIATITLELNEVSMKLYQCSKGTLKVLNSLHRPIHINMDCCTFANSRHQLTEELCTILNHFKSVMKEYEVTHYHAYVSDSVCRAVNQLFLFDQVLIFSDLKIQPLQSSKEHFLYLQAVSYESLVGVSTIKKNSLLLNFGWDALQLSYCNKDYFDQSVAIPIGFIELSTIIQKIEPQSNNLWNLLSGWIDESITYYQHRLFKEEKIKHLIGINGMISVPFRQCYLCYQNSLKNETLCFKERFLANQPGPILIAYDNYQKFLQVLKETSIDSICYSLSISKEKAFLLLAQALIYLKLFQITLAEDLSLSSLDLCDAIGIDYLLKNKLTAKRLTLEEWILESTNQLAKRFHCDRTHTGKVEAIALELFDALHSIHGLGHRDRLLLQIAVRLHSCGLSISLMDPSFYSYQMILANPIPGLTSEELKLIALIVRYEKDRPPLPDSMETVITDGHYITLSKLTNLFRIGNCLCQSNEPKIESMKIVCKDNFCILSVKSNTDLTLEHVALEKNADYFEEVFGFRPILKLRKEHLPWETLN